MIFFDLSELIQFVMQFKLHTWLWSSTSHSRGHHGWRFTARCKYYLTGWCIREVLAIPMDWESLAQRFLKIWKISKKLKKQRKISKLKFHYIWNGISHVHIVFNGVVILPKNSWVIVELYESLARSPWLTVYRALQVTGNQGNSTKINVFVECVSLPGRRQLASYNAASEINCIWCEAPFRRLTVGRSLKGQVAVTSWMYNF